MTNIDNLFKELSPHIEMYIENKKKRMETGFNLFYLISDYYYRETFHGDIIAALLDPMGKHNKGIAYVSLFVNMINSKKQLVEKKYYESESTRVIKEQPTDDGILKGRIDIFIEGTDKHCIVVENKLYNAGDTNRQMPKYYKDLKQKGYNIDAFVYLPLDPNKEPNKSDWSAEESNFIDERLVIIPAYTTEGVNLVKDWLIPAENDSIGDAKFIIKQYKTLLNNLTIDVMDNKNIIDVLSKDKKNIETTLDILENCNAFCNKMIDMFVQKLSIKANKAGYGFNKKGESENRIEISNGRWKYVIDKYSTSGYWRGIETDNENNLISKTDHFFGENTKCDNSKYPLGWNYFKGNLCNWSNLSTIREMLNGSFADDIIKEVQSAFKKMDELHK